MAAAKTGTVFFMGLNSKSVYSKQIYDSDVVNVLARIDAGSGTPGAGEGADFCSFEEPVSLIGMSVVTGITDTHILRVMINYAPTPYVLDWDSSVNTLANRPTYNIGIGAGKRISLMQLH